MDSGYHVVGMMSPQAAPEVAEMLRNFSSQS